MEWIELLASSIVEIVIDVLFRLRMKPCYSIEDLLNVDGQHFVYPILQKGDGTLGGTILAVTANYRFKLVKTAMK